ncbi:MAG: Holliday junction branch migration protein RuvA [Rickettsiales bacterium]|jgi:Holliday junction DNA helicase RuvA|nr:Holliday junction branch migration protein RuvA [Rickettsiales bacterium]
MIGKLTGIVDSIRESSLILDVGGVGFEIHCSTKTLNCAPALGEKMSLFIETVVREDSLMLFGFLSQSEQTCFNTLCRVNGVGSKIVLKIMGTVAVDDILLAISAKDKDIFCEIPGIGPKLAARIVTELQNCAMLKNFVPSEFNSSVNSGSGLNSSRTALVIRDAINALEGLGYQRGTISSIVASVVGQNPDLVLESVITESLRKINNF